MTTRKSSNKICIKLKCKKRVNRRQGCSHFATGEYLWDVPSSGRICTIATVVYSRAIKSTRDAHVTQKQSCGTGRTLEAPRAVPPPKTERPSAGANFGAYAARDTQTDGATSSASYPCNTCGCLCLAVGQGARPRSPSPGPAAPQPPVRTLTSGIRPTTALSSVSLRFKRLTHVQCFHVLRKRGDAIRAHSIRALSRNFSRWRIASGVLQGWISHWMSMHLVVEVAAAGLEKWMRIVRSWVGRLRSVTSSASHKYKCPVYSLSWFCFGCFSRLII